MQQRFSNGLRCQNWSNIKIYATLLTNTFLFFGVFFFYYCYYFPLSFPMGNNEGKTCKEEKHNTAPYY